MDRFGETQPFLMPGEVTRCFVHGHEQISHQIPPR